MLKEIRNTLVGNRHAQSFVRSAARLGILPAAIHQRLPPLGPHPVTSPGGREFIYFADYADMLARRIVWENLRVWEASTLKAFSRLASSAERVLDIGAYTGIYSLVACADGCAEVIAFEPNPSSHLLLERNVKVNGWQHRITVVPMAVSNAPGAMRLTIPFDNTATRLDENGQGPEIEVTTMDAVLSGRRVDLIKVDVEGFEPMVLEGGREAMRRSRPALILECLSAEAFESQKEILAPLGYRSCRHFGPKGPAETASFVNMPRYANYLWTCRDEALGRG
jgi:FkbM family methyltransferase